METKTFTELLKFETLETTTAAQVLEKAELIKALEGNIWYFIYHIESPEKLKSVGEKLRNSRLFDELNPLIVSGSMNVSFFRSIKNWQKE